MATTPIPVSIVPTVQILSSGNVVAPGGRFSAPVYAFFRDLVTALAAIVPAVNAAAGAVSVTLAQQPTLTLAQAGTTVQITDYGHFVRWNGTFWEFAPGDQGNTYYLQFGIAPTAPGWHLADGNPTDYLTVGGAVLTATPFVTALIPGSFFRR